MEEKDVLNVVSRHVVKGKYCNSCHKTEGQTFMKYSSLLPTTEKLV